MSQINGESNELKILKQEVEELQNSKKKSIVQDNNDLENEQKEDREPGLGSAGAEANPISSKSLSELTAYAEDFVLEIKDVAKERPALALLGAFTIGIIVGRLFSRK